MPRGTSKMDFCRKLFWMKYMDIMGVCCVAASEGKATQGIPNSFVCHKLPQYGDQYVMGSMYTQINSYIVVHATKQ
jgi:hypothetical protein